MTAVRIGQTRQFLTVQSVRRHSNSHTASSGGTSWIWFRSHRNKALPPPITRTWDPHTGEIRFVCQQRPEDKAKMATGPEAYLKSAIPLALPLAGPYAEAAELIIHGNATK